MKQPLGEVAAAVHRLAVLLAAGIAPGSAWGYLGSAAPVVDARDVPGSLVEASATMPTLQGQAWRGVAAAWTVAIDAGAPLAPALRGLAGALRSLATAQRDAAVALAGPVATARLVMALPPIGVAFSLALGFDTLGVLFGTAPGWVCLVVGAALILLGLRWSRRLVAAAQPVDATPGIEYELTAIALGGGASLPRARSAVEAAVARFGLASGSAVDAVLELSSRAGVPAAELLRAEADRARDDARAEAQERAARLGVRLMLPLGLCALPAFMVLGVIPLMLSVLTSTLTLSP